MAGTITFWRNLGLIIRHYYKITYWIIIVRHSSCWLPQFNVWWYFLVCTQWCVLKLKTKDDLCFIFNHLSENCHVWNKIRIRLEYQINIFACKIMPLTISDNVIDNIDWLILNDTVLLSVLLTNGASRWVVIRGFIYNSTLFTCNL